VQRRVVARENWTSPWTSGCPEGNGPGPPGRQTWLIRRSGGNSFPYRDLRKPRAWLVAVVCAIRSGKGSNSQEGHRARGELIRAGAGGRASEPLVTREHRRLGAVWSLVEVARIPRSWPYSPRLPRNARSFTNRTRPSRTTRRIGGSQPPGYTHVVSRIASKLAADRRCNRVTPTNGRKVRGPP
jgi:hypothetical protein